jgi:hypothetical protein
MCHPRIKLQFLFPCRRNVDKAPSQPAINAEWHQVFENSKAGAARSAMPIL